MVFSPAEVYFEGLLDIATKRGLKTLVVINEDTLFPKAAAIGTATLAKRKGLQLVFRDAGVVQMRQCKIPLESPRPFADLSHVGENHLDDAVVGDEFPWLRDFGRRCSGLDPRPHKGNVGSRRSFLITSAAYRKQLSARVNRRVAHYKLLGSRRFPHDAPGLALGFL